MALAGLCLELLEVLLLCPDHLEQPVLEIAVSIFHVYGDNLRS